MRRDDLTHRFPLFQRPCIASRSLLEQRLLVNMPTTLKDFESVWPRIVADLESHAKSYKLPQQPLDWFVQVRR